MFYSLHCLHCWRVVVFMNNFQHAIGCPILTFIVWTFQFAIPILNWWMSFSTVDRLYLNCSEIATFENPAFLSSKIFFCLYWTLSWTTNRLDLRVKLGSKFNFLSPGIYILGISHGVHKYPLLVDVEFLREILLQLLVTEILCYVLNIELISYTLYVKITFRNQLRKC